MMLSVPKNTVITLVGPSGAGKSTFVEQLQAAHGNAVASISSDNCRREVIGAQLQKSDPYMMHASVQGFDLLHTKLELMMQYPVRRHVIVVDSTGLNEGFRSRVRTAAKENGYQSMALVFDYDGPSAYPGDDMPDVTRRHHRKMRKQMRDITTTEYTAGTHRIESPDAFPSVQIDGLETFNERIAFSPNGKFFFVGDLHGCYDEFIALLEKNDYAVDAAGKITHPDDQPIVLLGDMVDKGPKTLELLELVAFNHGGLEPDGLIATIIGNHDDWCYRYATGDIVNVEDHVHLFTDAKMFKEDPYARKLLSDVMEVSEPVLYGEHFVATHAPTPNQKLFNNDERMHTRFRYPREDDFDDRRDYLQALDETFRYVKDEAEGCYPFHLFGHVNVPDAPYRHRNKLCLDGGVYKGGRLAGAVVNGLFSVYMTSVPSQQEGDGPSVNPFEPGVTRMSDLHYKERGRVRHMAEEKRQYLGPTMSPGPKGIEQGEKKLESLAEAVNYFGGPVHVQPKYMGSRLQAYLPMTEASTFGEPRFSTRGGYPWQGSLPVNLEDVYSKLTDSLTRSGYDPNTVDYVMLDCELMPWSTLGDGLIKSQYLPVLSGIERELLAQDAFGMREALRRLRTTNAYDVYKTAGLSRSELKEAIGYRVHQTMEAIDDYEDHAPSEVAAKVGVRAFREQLKNHAADGDPYLQPFDVLKIVFDDGTQVIPHLEKDWLTDTRYTYARPTSRFDAVRAAPGDLDAAYDLYDEIREANLEGVVVKPLSEHGAYAKGKPPYLKVRTPEYLTIAYGPEYLDRLDDLYERRSIGCKLRVSLEETKLARELLELRPDQLQTDTHKQILAEFIAAEKEEEHLDPTF